MRYNDKTTRELSELSESEGLDGLVEKFKIDLPNIKKKDIIYILGKIKTIRSKLGSKLFNREYSPNGSSYKFFGKSYSTEIEYFDHIDGWYDGKYIPPIIDENNIDLGVIFNFLKYFREDNEKKFNKKFGHLLLGTKEILEQNPDSIYGVYNLKSENEKGYEIEYLENILTCYPNQFEDLKGKNLISPDITIINIGPLREGKIEVLHGDENLQIKNPVLLSNGVVEYVESEYIEDGETKTRKHIITTQRDGGAFDVNQRTTIAGRNTTDNLEEDLEIEQIGEAPFLGKNKKGEYVLCVSDNSTDKVKYLEEGIKKFLDEKYLKNPSKRDLELIENISDTELENILEVMESKNTIKLFNGLENNMLIYIEKYKDALKYRKIVKLFERSFPGIKYEELGDILEEIVENKRYLEYETKNGKIEGLENDIKNIKLGNTQGDYFVYHDKSNNTIEYRKVLQITKTPEDFFPISKRPGRLYLESVNQYPRSPRISNANNIHKLVPTVKFLCEKSLEKIYSNKYKKTFLEYPKITDDAINHAIVHMTTCSGNHGGNYNCTNCSIKLIVTNQGEDYDSGKEIIRFYHPKELKKSDIKDDDLLRYFKDRDYFKKYM